MAQRETIASIDIDETEAVSALKATGAQFQVLEGGASRTAGQITHEFDRAGPAFVHHMFSMRAAAAAFLGGFSLAGIISELALLTKQTIEADPAFQNLAKSAGLLKAELLGMAQGGVVTAGLQDVTQWMDRLSASIEAVKTSVGSLPGTADEKIGFIGKILFGTAGMSWVPEALTQVGSLMDKILDKQLKGIAANRDIGKVAPGEEFKFNAFEEWQKAIKEREAGLAAQEKGSTFGTPAFGMEGLGKQFIYLNELIDKTDLSTIHLGDSLKNMTQGWNDKPIKEWTESADLSLKKLQWTADTSAVAFGAMASAMTQSLAAWSQGGSFVIGKFFAAMLVGVGQSLLAYGALAIVKAWIEERPEGYAVGWAAIAAGAAALAAARVVGGGASGGGASAGGGTSQQSQSIQIFFEGNVGDEAFFRRAAMQIGAALRDGAAGGSL